MMKPWVKVCLCVAAFVVAATLAAFLIDQGLSQAGTWATVLGLPIAILSAGAGVWSAVLAARTLRETRSPAVAPLKIAHVELVDAAVDPDVRARISGAQDTDASPTTENIDVRPEVDAIDFKFINRGDAVAVLHQFTISILDFRLDTSPVLEYSYLMVGRASSDKNLVRDRGFRYGTSLELKISNFGWGSALDFTATLTSPILADLYPQSALSFESAQVESGTDLTFTLLVEGADRAVMDRLRERRAAVLGKAMTALAEVDERILGDPDFLTLLSFHEQWHIREFLSDYPRTGNSPCQQWHQDYISELDSDYLPIRLEMRVGYADQDGRRYSGDTVALTDPNRPMTEGELWIGPTGFLYMVHKVFFDEMLSHDGYAVILNPEDPNERKYRISRSIAPGDADRFHVVLASRMSGDFYVQLSFNFNGTQIVQSDPLLVSLNHPRNARLPTGLPDGVSFKLRDERLELGGNFGLRHGELPPW